MAVVGNSSVYNEVPVTEVINENNDIYVNNNISDDGENETHSEFQKKKVLSYGCGIRHVQIVILFICVVVGNIARGHMGVSLLSMNNVYSTDRDYNTSNVRGSDNEDSIWNVYRIYDWSKSTQHLVFFAFFIGYVVTMFPSGIICQRFGGKLPLQICFLTNGIVSLITPSVAVWGGWKAVCCCRVMQGLSQGALYPSIHTLLAKWAPISERTTLTSIAYGGTLLGTLNIAFDIGTMMNNSAVGWPGMFWLTGALCIGTFAAVSVFIAASPNVHKTIRKNEKYYILGKINDDRKNKVSKVPWRHIFTSKPLWCTFAAHISSDICYIFICTEMPLFMRQVLNSNIKYSAHQSTLFYIVNAFTSISFGLTSDFCINRGYLSTRTARVVCNSIVQLGQAVLMLMIIFTNDAELADFLLIMALGLFNGVYSGSLVNYIDLSPNFSGFLIATGITFSKILTIFVPVIFAFMVNDVSDQYQWRIVTFVIAAVAVGSNTLFAFFASADPQPWDKVDEQEDTETELKPLDSKLTEECTQSKL